MYIRYWIVDLLFINRMGITMNSDQKFCTAWCDNAKCDRKIGYSDMRRAESEGRKIDFADLSEGCKDLVYRGHPHEFNSK